VQSKELRLSKNKKGLISQPFSFYSSLEKQSADDARSKCKIIEFEIFLATSYCKTARKNV
jgi:hypothetical protein